MAGGIPVSSPLITEAYTDIPGADAYFATRLGTDDWDNASTADKTKALLQSTRRIDALYYQGVKTADYNQSVLGITGSQDLQFPRNGDINVPNDIIIACCECALAFLGGADTDMDIVGAGILDQGFASVRQSKRGGTVQAWILAGIPSPTAWLHLKPYLADPFQVSLTRIS